ncbi:polymerase [Streptococcus infantarius subsp. infantarius]|uniref:polymerase n=1 Tax=Streptococcus infantarius TaxID=102684 RepID=UPI001BDB4988|nr:polymerase [Streptococcus infantarius]MBT0904034.1 polymerase [Streptococcus infantarius subsp. infantarius]MBT0917947.1 polymerase [Streptococcus infantarius subsp. infantarius]
MKLILNKNISITVLLYAVLIIVGIYSPPIVSLIFALLFITVVSYLNTTSIFSGNAKANSFFAAFPVIISCFQNLYLGLAANRLNTITLQVMLTIGIAIVAFTLFLGITLKKFVKSEFNWLLFCIFEILFQSIFLSLFYPTSFAAYLSSLRNILAPLLILLYSVYSFKKIDVSLFYKLIFNTSIIVILFGFVEYLIGNNLWISLNITKLWELKGMPLKGILVPGNWYSSEMIGGNQLRRMVSSFADPVNLGSYLFVAFMLAWYRRKRILQFLLFFSFLLCVSKGAFLSFLVFIVVYSWINDKNKILAILGMVISLSAGVLFYIFSQNSSSGSMNAHINGFLSALTMPLKYPLGMGAGNVGVLASKLGSTTALNSSVLETGIGMVISQFGFIGALIYTYFFGKLLLIGKGIGGRRDKILWYTLILGFLANAMFNEVALSPNSCSLYFLTLGFLYNLNFTWITEKGALNL